MRTQCTVWVLAALATTACASAGTIATTAYSAADEGPSPKALKIAESGEAFAVTVQLAGLDKGTAVHAARLRARRGELRDMGDLLTDIEIYVGREAVGKPLRLVGPSFDAFDATEAVRKALAAGGELKLFVMPFPGWVQDSTRLEVTYAGKPKDPPPAAAGLKVFHRAGQTFITFKEVDPLIKADQATWGEIRKKLATAGDSREYLIYAHDRPISAESLAAAELVARAGPLSGYNLNGRNLEYLICQAMIKPDQMGELCRNHNHYMYTWHMSHPRMDRYPVQRFVIDEKAGPLPVGTGLYVHSPAKAGRRHYAVVSCRGGVANSVDFSPANALARPVAETVGPGEPVHQGPGLWGPYFDYPGRRQVYVQWCAPPLSPRPSMYFNWSVLVPPGLKAGQKAPAELYFHDGNFSYAKPRQKYILKSIQIAPHDWPFSGWYGFNDSWGTLKSFKDGVVSNHTQKRFVSFLKWASTRLPLDPDRTIVCGSDGAAALALNYRSMFAYALIGGFGGAGKVQGRVLNPAEAKRFAAAWGPKDQAIKDDKGRANWGWAMLDDLARERPGEHIPLILCSGTSWGGKRFYGSGHGPFYGNMQKMGQPVIAGHGWNKKLIPPDWYTGLWGPRRYSPATKPIDMTCKTPVPAFANSSGTHMSLQDGNVNFDHTWQDVVDEPGRFQIAIRGPGKVDMTLRRIQKFKLEGGELVRWQAKPVLGRRDKKEDHPPAEGTVEADEHALVTLKNLKIPGDRLVVTLTRAK